MSDANRKAYQEIAKALRIRLEALEISPRKDTRFDEMIRLCEAEGPFPLSDLAALRACKDVAEFQFIIDILAEKTMSANHERRFREALLDPLQPDGKSNSPGRDRQFELLVEAVLTKAGLQPRFATLPGRPDFLVTFCNRDYAVEAKRLKSINRFQEQIEKSFDQLAKSGVTGFVAMDPGSALRPGADFVSLPVSDSAQFTDWTRECKDFFDEPINGMKRLHHIIGWKRARDVRGMFFMDWVVRNSPESALGHDAMYYGVPFDQHHQRRQMVFHLFQAQFHKGLPTPPGQSDLISTEARTSLAALPQSKIVSMLPKR